MPEPTATNPQTGEKIVFRNGQWVPMTAAPAAPAPQANGPVYGAPPPGLTPMQQQQLGIDQQRLGIDIAQENRQQGNAALTQQKTALEIQRLQQQVAEDDPTAKQAKTAASLLTAAGVDLARGVDPISDLIRGSTSGRAQAIGANIWGGVTGDATDGMENIGRLKTIVSDMTLQLTGGSLGTQISNADREFIMERVGNLADPNVPADQRLAAWEQVKQRMANLTGVEYRPPAQSAGRDDEQAAAGANPYASIIGEDGKPLGPGGGYGRNPETGEWGLYGPNQGPTEAENFAQFQTEQFGPMGAVDLAGQGITLGLSDEAAGVGNAIGSALSGNFNFADNYTVGRDAERIRLDDARQRLGWGGTAAEVLGGGALGRVEGGINALMGAGRSVAARGAPVTRSAIQSQMVRNAGVEGAMAGGGGGFGYGDGLQGSATNALIGAATGGVIGAGGQMIGNSIANRTRPQVSGAQVQQAADDLSIPVIPAVTGGTTARRLTSGARQGFISDRPIAGAVEAMEEAGGAARNRAASQTGRVMDNEDAGNVVRQAANVYSRRTSQIGGNLYDRADRMAGGVQLPLPKAVQTADRWLTELGESVEGADAQLYKDIKALRDKMANGQFSVRGIRLTRTALREQMQERGLRGSATDKVMGEILQAATEDLYDGLSNAGRQNAANALRTANAFWQKRVETIDEVLEPILGMNSPRSGEQIVTAVENLMKPKTGNGARLRQLFQAMPQGERQSVAATIISRMGQPTPGAAQTGSGFSFNTFLTNYNNMSPRSRAAIFPDATRSALDKLATVSQGVKQAGAAMNSSNTAGAVGVQALISTPLIWLADPMTVVAATGGQWVVGRLLASPRIARWIASAPAQPTSAYIAKLGGIARAEPALANEIGIFERALRGANDNAATVTNVAAQEPNADQR